MSTVYSAELIGIYSVLRKAVRDGRTLKTADIFVNNQAAIYSSFRPRGHSGQYMLEKIISAIKTLNNNHVTTDFNWIAGKEVVDRLAKEVSGQRKGDRSPTRCTLDS